MTLTDAIAVWRGKVKSSYEEIDNERERWVKGIEQDLIKQCQKGRLNGLYKVHLNQFEHMEMVKRISIIQHWAKPLGIEVYTHIENMDNDNYLELRASIRNEWGNERTD